MSQPSTPSRPCSGASTPDSFEDAESVPLSPPRSRSPSPSRTDPPHPPTQSSSSPSSSPSKPPLPPPIAIPYSPPAHPPHTSPNATPTLTSSSSPFPPEPDLAGSPLRRSAFESVPLQTPPILLPASPSAAARRTSSTIGLRSPAEDGPDAQYGLLLKHAEETVAPAEQEPASLQEGKKELLGDFEKLQEEEGAGAGIDWGFWGDVMANYEHVARTNPQGLSKAIQQGIPKELRGMVWQLMSTSKDPSLEALYLELLRQPSAHEKTITKDLARTFPSLSYFQDAAATDLLFNVAKAYSLFDPECGYTQGLLFVIGPLLINMPDEEAFCVLVRLMRSYDLRGHYLPEMPGLQLRLFQFDRLLEEMLPLLHAHMTRQGIKSSMYASQWFMTMFSYRFPLDLVYRIFDIVFAEGIEAVFRFSLALMKKNEDVLLKLNFEQILEFLKSGLFDTYKQVKKPETPGEEAATGEPGKSEQAQEQEHEYDADAFVNDAFEMRVTPFALDSFAAEWAEACRAVNAHAIEMDNLRSVNRALSSQVKQLEASLTQINLEHVDLVKQLVQAKIEKEEMEDELIKIKLAYAELSHRSADSLASSRISLSSASRRQTQTQPPSNGPSRTPSFSFNPFGSSTASPANGDAGSGSGAGSRAASPPGS